MKITKFLPILIAMMLVSPVFAESLAPGTASGQTNKDSAELSLTLPAFIDITKQTTTQASAVTYDDDYGNIHITTPISAKFQVITNHRVGDAVLLTAKAGNTAYNALRATSADAFYLAFANTNNVPEETAVADAVAAAPASEKNANVFTVKITPDIALTANSGATAPTVAYNTTSVKYPLTNGIYTFTYDLAQTAVDKTFSTLDTHGIYTATLTLTQTTP